jgi:TolA-binding protein
VWQWLLVPIILLCSPCYGISTSSGPTSDEEEGVLWEIGKTAFSESHYQDAINAFQRYLDRYPASAHYLQAQLALGKALIEQDENAKALPLLRSFVTHCRNHTDSAQGRLLLGRVYLNLKKFNEADLITLEINQLEKEKHLPPEILLESSLIQSEALLGLGHLDRAIEVLRQVEQQVAETSYSSIKGHAFGLEIKLKISDCARLPTQDPMNELQLRDQLDRRGTCLLESLLIYRKILQSNDPKSASLATSQIIRAFSQYANACSSKLHSPHDPHSPQVMKRTQLELKHYNDELSTLLQQDCKQKYATALNILMSWKAGLSPAMIQSLLLSTKHLENFRPARTP